MIALAIVIVALLVMFKIVPNPTFSCAVRLSIPGAEVPGELRITYRHKSKRELDAYQARAIALLARDDDDGAQDRYTDYIAEIIESWSGVVGPDGAPVPYSRDNLAALLQAFPSSGPEIVRRYSHELGHARQGN